MTHYETLGVTKGASAKDIKRAYRKLAMKFHPDRNLGDSTAESKFKKINEAQDVLLDGDKRAAYDRYGTIDPGAQSSGPFGFDFNSSQGGFGGAFTSTSSVNINDILSEMLRKGVNPGPQTQKHWRANISLLDAFRGTTININKATVRIPAGIRTGTRLVHDNELITVVVQEHPVFKRSGDDLLVDIEISAIDAMVGVGVSIFHLDDSVKLKFSIEPGIQNGEAIRLRGKGMPNPEIGGVGDLLIRCNIVIPRLTKEEISSIIHLRTNSTLDI